MEIRESAIRLELKTIERVRRELTEKINENRRLIRGLSLAEFSQLAEDLGEAYADDILGSNSNITLTRT